MKSRWFRSITVWGKVAVLFLCAGLLFAMSTGRAYPQSEPEPAPLSSYGDVPVTPNGNGTEAKSGDLTAPQTDTWPALPPAFERPRPAPPAPPVKKADFTGRYYGYVGQALHTWDFYSDGTFLHTRIVSGSGTRMRNSERGDFRLDDGYVELQSRKAATGGTTPGLGGRQTLALGGSEAQGDMRRLKIQFLKDGIMLDGQHLKVKHW